jgi:hypothetical protein
MGRALKIQKTGANQGIGSPGASVTLDAGYPNFGSLTNPVYNSAGTLSAADFLGVVGGSPATSTASATFPEISALVNISLADGTDSYTATSSYTGRIIRQKGSHKFLVAATGATIADEDMIVGQAYRLPALVQQIGKAWVLVQIQQLAIFLPAQQMLALAMAQFMQLDNAFWPTIQPQQLVIWPLVSR